MFEELSKEILSEIANVGDRTLFKANTHIDDLVMCIEQAVTECERAARSQADVNFSCPEVISGFHAAQKIMMAWWASEQKAS